MSSKKQKKEFRPGPGPGRSPQAEKLSALLLWAQRGECNCVACEYLRELGNKNIKEQIPKVLGDE